MKVHHIAKTTKHTYVIKYAASRFKKAAARGQLRSPWESAAAHTLFIFLAIAWLSSHTTSVLQTTIKGWWWLSKRTTTLWDYSGRRNRFLRITYICPDEQKVSTIEAEGTWPIPFAWNCHNNKASRLWRANQQGWTKLVKFRTLSKDYVGVMPCGVDPAEKQHSQKHLTLINCVLLEIYNLSWPVGDARRNNCPRSIRLFRIVICLLQMSFVRWWERHKGMFSWSSKQKPAYLC